MKRVPRNVRLDKTKKRSGAISCATYEVYARCRNCGWSGEVGVPKGIPVALHTPLDHRFPCPHCGCIELRRVEKVSGAMADAQIDQTLVEIREALERQPTRVVHPPPLIADAGDNVIPQDIELGVIELKPDKQLDEATTREAIDVFTRNATRAMAEQFNAPQSRHWIDPAG